MTTLFDVGDEIEVTLRGVVRQYTISGVDNDCYTITLKGGRNDGNYIYLDSKSLAEATRTKDREDVSCESEK